MAAATFVWLSLAGGLGALCRFWLEVIISARVTSRFPWATFLINLIGSFLLGVIIGLATSNVMPEKWELIAGGGFLGGYTTFSTASVDTVRLIQQRAWLPAALNGFGVLAVTVCAAAFGLFLTSIT